MLWPSDLPHALLLIVHEVFSKLWVPGFEFLLEFSENFVTPFRKVFFKLFVLVFQSTAINSIVLILDLREWVKFIIIRINWLDLFFWLHWLRLWGRYRRLWQLLNWSWWCFDRFLNWFDWFWLLLYWWMIWSVWWINETQIMLTFLWGLMIDILDESVFGFFNNWRMINMFRLWSLFILVHSLFLNFPFHLTVSLITIGGWINNLESFNNINCYWAQISSY